jgi:hypothetical protein
MMLWCLCVQKPIKKLYQPRKANLKVCKTTVLFLFPAFAEEDEENKNTNNLDIVVTAVRLDDDYDIVIAV